VYKGDTLGRGDAPVVAEPEVKEPREERKPARRAPAKKAKDTSASKEAPAPAEAPAADVKKPVKRVRKASAPAAEKPAS